MERVGELKERELHLRSVVKGLLRGLERGGVGKEGMGVVAMLS